MTRTTDSRDRVFKATVRAFARTYFRSFPWRDTTDPYRILVSEIMLQQTQTDRVVPKYRNFIKRFPTVRALAKAPLADVLREWNGLGYNRRAKLLHACAKEVVTAHKGKFPRTHDGLVRLPGIGPYTAGAVLAFAFNIPHPVIETNIRTVYLYHFYPDDEGVTDRELMVHIERTIDRKDVRRWYAMLMDYGSWIKKHHGNHNIRSRSYAKQSKFKGSTRELRGKILRALGMRSMTTTVLRKAVGAISELPVQLKALRAEGLIERRGGSWQLPS